MSVLTIAPDWMHVKHLGTDKYIYGSVLYVLVIWVLAGTEEQYLETVWKDLQAFYERHNTSSKYSQMKRAMFVAKATPKLKGEACEVKAMGSAPF